VGCFRRRWPARDDDVYFELNQFSCECRESFDAVSVISSLKQKVLSFDVSQFPQPLEKSSKRYGSALGGVPPR
jgi:hypothetical protein